MREVSPVHFPTPPKGEAEEEQPKRPDLADDACWDEDALKPKDAWPYSENMIVFDWDDTLLCSSAINAARWTLDDLQQLEKTIQAVLLVAMRLGPTLIVTNGNYNWVDDSARRFIPGILPTLGHLKVISARAAYESMYPGDPMAWKCGAFRDLLAKRCSSKVNLVIIGDSIFEMQAAVIASRPLGGLAVLKTVKFKVLPSVDDLLGQQRKLAQDLEEIVNCRISIDRTFVRRRVPGNMSLVPWASGWLLQDGEAEDVDEDSAGESQDGNSRYSTLTHVLSSDPLQLLGIGFPRWALDLGRRAWCNNAYGYKVDDEEASHLTIAPVAISGLT